MNPLATLVRRLGQAMAITLGSAGVFCLWASFYAPMLGLHAAVLILLAAAMQFALDL